MGTRADDLTDGHTEDIRTVRPAPSSVRRFRLEVVEGPGQGREWRSRADRCAVGSDASNDLMLEDPAVSRFHCEIRLEVGGPRIRDLDSRNGTLVDGVQVNDAYLRDASLLRIGRSVVRFGLERERNRLVLSQRTRFGGLVGESVPMRAAFSVLERAAESSTTTVLIEGETGTGKEGAAEALHQEGPRREGPFVVVDCSALPKELLESELFGHERGAFTGAVTRRIGAFEEAHGGTLFLDEVGELPIEIQPKLLRVLEQREIRRLGSNVHEPVDVRVIAATNRDLRAEVNAGRFRADLYFRLAVVRVVLPPLRSRLEDLPLLVAEILGDLGAPAEATERLGSPELLAQLEAAAWPGNVRELRNYLEQCLVLRDAQPPAEAAPADAPSVDAALPYEGARQRALDEFERRYVAELLLRHGGNVSQAARAARMARGYLHRLMRRHQIAPLR